MVSNIFLIFTPILGVEDEPILTCAYFSTAWFNHQLSSVGLGSGFDSSSFAWRALVHITVHHSQIGHSNTQRLNVWSIYLHLGSLGGKCRYIYHTLSIWETGHSQSIRGDPFEGVFWDRLKMRPEAYLCTSNDGGF